MLFRSYRIFEICALRAGYHYKTTFFIFMVIWLGLPIYLGSEAVVRLTETIFNNKQKDDLNNQKKTILPVDPKTSPGKGPNQPQKIQGEINDNYKPIFPS